MRKVYFYDLGVRNALINNFNPLELRQDVGALLENFFIVERLKYNYNRRRNVNVYFWRTYDCFELDCVEEEGGRMMGYECKWREQRWRPPGLFAETYPNSTVHLVHRATYLEFLI